MSGATPPTARWRARPGGRCCRGCWRAPAAPSRAAAASRRAAGCSAPRVRAPCRPRPCDPDRRRRSADPTAPAPACAPRAPTTRTRDGSPRWLWQLDVQLLAGVLDRRQHRDHLGVLVAVALGQQRFLTLQLGQRGLDRLHGRIGRDGRDGLGGGPRRAPDLLVERFLLRPRGAGPRRGLVQLVQPGDDDVLRSRSDGVVAGAVLGHGALALSTVRCWRSSSSISQVRLLLMSCWRTSRFCATYSSTRALPRPRRSRVRGDERHVHQAARAPAPPTRARS